jgi:CRP-like cAMP-binding protein
VIALLAEDVRLMDARLLDALYCPADKRLLRRLDELAELYGGGNEVEIPLTQEQLAQLLCASRATVSQLLRDEERRGTLERRRRRTIVLDREQIARRAR